MQKMQVVMWVALAAAVSIPVYFFRRSKEVYAGFHALVAERGFVARTASPVAALVGKDPPENMHYHLGYDGTLRGGAAVTLLLLRRTESIMVQGVPMQTFSTYVGAYLPPPSGQDAAWLKGWEDRVSRRVDDVVYAGRAAEGGALIVWRGAPSKQLVSRHLDALASSLSGGGR